MDIASQEAEFDEDNLMEAPEVILGDMALEEDREGPCIRLVYPSSNVHDLHNSAGEEVTPTTTVDTVDKVNFTPYLRQLQQIVLYETKSRFYIIGCDVASSRFHILKVDRTEPRELVITEEASTHSKREIIDILNMVDSGNYSKVGQKIGSGLTKKLSAFGIAGFIRFLEGYYIVFITKRRKAAMIGPHCIYKIEDIHMRYIPNDDVRQSHVDEARYMKMFLACDLSSNFYFSYSYDLTNTLQHNMATPKYVLLKDGQWQKLKSAFPHGLPAEVSYVSVPNERYMWNEYLIEPVENKIKSDWVLPIIHGFVDQANISIHARPILLTLVARRSNRFAGTRFLKRGSNFQGDCANEVETEQIVIDSAISDLSKANVTSFVQLRASVPGHWAQDISKMVPKPQIFFELTDPYGRTSGSHFNKLMMRYGSPIVILNLVKKREKRRRHECLLSEELFKQVDYLNTFLRKRDRIHYIHMDMARCKSRKDTEVMSTLADIASFSIKKTGIFQGSISDRDGPKKAKSCSMVDTYLKRLAQLKDSSGSFLRQTGVVRTNCVDCLDRTNTAQFVVGKCALGLQLYAMGFVESPDLAFNSDCARILETMFEDHGDTLALQYGGSQLIHRIKSYRKESKWTNKANDITQTLRRYYSNTLSDAEKQNAINIFLGIFRPRLGAPAIWDKDFTTDHYHHLPALCAKFEQRSVLSQIGTHWWDPDMKKALPFSLNEERKSCLELVVFDRPQVASDVIYEDVYRPAELTVMNDFFQFKDVGHSVRDYMPHCCTDFSPFVVRDREVKRREDALYTLKSNSTISFANLFSVLGTMSRMTYRDANASHSMEDIKRRVTAAEDNSEVDPKVSTTSDSDEDETSTSDDYDWLREASSECLDISERAIKFEDVLGKETKPELKTVSAEDMKLYHRLATVSLTSECKTSMRNIILMRHPIPIFSDTETSRNLKPTSESCNRTFYEKVVSMDYSCPEKDRILYQLCANGVKLQEDLLQFGFSPS